MRFSPRLLPVLPMLCASLLLLPTATTCAAEDDKDAARAKQLAEAVVKASGGDEWATIKTIRFTFQVEQPGKTEPLLSAKHVWDVAGNKDTVTWAGKTVTIDLGAPNTEGDAQAAMKRWTNDSYWLMAPLKLRDPGVRLAYGGQGKLPDGRAVEQLDVSFDKVGMTNGDRYRLYVDPQTHQLLRWDYKPSPDKTISSGWENYQQVGGLTLSTEHDFGDKRLRILDVEVQR